MPSFPVPKDFQLPDGVNEGQEFSAVGTFVLQGGELTLKAVDDAPIEGYEDDEEDEPMSQEEPMDDEESFTSAVEKRMGPGKMPG